MTAIGPKMNFQNARTEQGNENCCRRDCEAWYGCHEEDTPMMHRPCRLSESPRIHRHTDSATSLRKQASSNRRTALLRPAPTAGGRQPTGFDPERRPRDYIAEGRWSSSEELDSGR